jgi:ketosteroid isomerase-like protein
MNVNEQLITKFYTAFQQRDYKTMQDCYSTDIVFFDPAFGLLHGDEARAMWEMLCKRAKDFSLDFSDVVSADEYGNCNWVATYTFSNTGRKVVNKVKAYMKIADGKIIEHSDAFRLGEWAAQALGWKGQLFGWTNFIKKRIQKTSRKALEEYMRSNGYSI